MAHGQLNPVLRFIRQLDGQRLLAAQSDVQLLDQFVMHHDESAFAALLKRHGPMVLAVCRRILHDAHEAEDAFQVTFLVLARKAKTLGQRELLGNWLHGVAYRTALKARSRLTRWRYFTGPLSDVPARQPLRDLAWGELQWVLDEELQRLPAKYRAPAVLCCLEGHSFAEAARQLGWPVGTVAGRLARARELLRSRLTRRGFTLSAGLLGTLLSAHATSAAVPVALSDFTVTAALAFAAGRVSASVVSAKVAALTEGVMKAMFLQKLKVAAVGALVAALVVVGSSLSGLVAQDCTNEKDAPVGKTDEKKPVPVAKPTGPGSLVLLRPGSIGIVTPDGTKGIEFILPDNSRTLRAVALSPDGSRVAFVVNDKDAPLLNAADQTHPLKVVVCKAEKSAAEKVMDLPAIDIHLSWTADGKKLIAAKTTELPPNARYESILLDPETGNIEDLGLPVGVRVLDIGKDGKTFVVETFEAKTRKKALGIATTGADTIRVLTALQGHTGRAIAQLSPDGAKLLLIDGDPERKDAHRWGASDRPYLVDVKTGKRAALSEFPANGRSFGVAWSPDGKRLAYTWQPLDEELLKKDTLGGGDARKETEGYLVIADADGKNAKTIVTDKGRFALNTVLGAIQWR